MGLAFTTNVVTLPLAVTLICTLIFTLWARRGLDRLGKTAAGPTYRALSRATTLTLAMTLALAAAGALVAGKMLSEVTATAIGVCLATPALLHAALDPTRRGFWYHRRVRPLGILAFAVLGAVLGRLAADPIFTAPVIALVIFQRHLSASQAIAADAHEELAAICQKLVVRATTAANERTLKRTLRAAPATTGASVNDKLPKAG